MKMWKKLDFSFFSFFFENSVDLCSHFRPSNNHRTWNVNSSDWLSQRACSGNEIKSKFECMELLQKLTFSTKNYRFVASLPDRVFSYLVLLFESRMRHPALRVTSINKLFQINRFDGKFPEKLMKMCSKLDFSLFSFFFENSVDLCPHFRPSYNL